MALRAGAELGVGVAVREVGATAGLTADVTVAAAYIGRGF